VSILEAMFRARLICSDDDCTEVFEAYGALAELEALACECGCGLAVVGFPLWVNDAVDGVELDPVAA